MSLTVAILAGGLATRLRPVTEKIPKALIDVNGEPFVFHQLRLLKRHGLQKVVFCLGYLGEMIQERVGDGSLFGIDVSYSFDGPVLMGTGGAIKRALPLLGREFFVLYGDSYLECDYSAVEKAFHDSEALALMTVFENSSRWDQSNVEFSDGRIVRYSKVNRNSRMTYIDYGLGVLSKEPFDSLPEDSPVDLASIYESLAEESALAAFEVRQRFFEVGSFEGIEEFGAYLKLTGEK